MEPNSEHNRIRSFRDLLVRQTGIALTKAVDSLTQRFPAEQKFGLVSQMRRSGAEIAQYIPVSLESLAELKTRKSTSCRECATP